MVTNTQQCAVYHHCVHAHTQLDIQCTLDMSVPPRVWPNVITFRKLIDYSLQLSFFSEMHARHAQNNT